MPPWIAAIRNYWRIRNLSVFRGRLAIAASRRAWGRRSWPAYPLDPAFGARVRDRMAAAVFPLAAVAWLTVSSAMRPLLAFCAHRTTIALWCLIDAIVPVAPLGDAHFVRTDPSSAARALLSSAMTSVTPARAPIRIARAKISPFDLSCGLPQMR